MKERGVSDMAKEKRVFKLPYAKRKSLYGYGFIALWLTGAVFMFILPVIESLEYSFREVNPQAHKMAGEWVGLANYKYAFLENPDFSKNLVSVLKDTALKTPLIIIFSLFVAVILNQKFRGRGFARAVFFLPVIIATGPVYNIITGDISTNGNNNASQFSTMFETDLVGQLLEFMGIYNISEHLTTMIQTVTTDIFNLVWHSGVQILIFLAGLQNIPVSAKEAAQIEGATGWEFFWKITFPYVSPMILANLIFTIIDLFTDPANKVMKTVIDMQSEWKYGRAAAMTWAYFLIVLVAVGIVVAIVNKFIYYEVE